MARNTKRGKCELCGEVANVGTNHGSATCPKCTHVQAALANRLQAVAKAARAMGKAEDLIKALIPDGGLAVHVTAELLREISGIVGYEGEDPAELVESVRRRVLTCASCEAEDVLHEIREIVGYTPERGDKGLADAVRALVASGGDECNSEELRLRDDLARACGMDQDCSYRWGSVAQGAIQEIAWLNELIGIGEAKLILAEQARDEWEQRCAAAEESMQDMEAELCNREDEQAAPCASTTYLLDIALRALRGEGPDADQLATLLDAARREA